MHNTIFKGGKNMEEKIKQFLEFRKQFTKRQWFEINQAVHTIENQKADQIKLDDSDIQKVLEIILRHI